jgi:hypothetical protein
MNDLNWRILGCALFVRQTKFQLVERSNEPKQKNQSDICYTQLETGSTFYISPDSDEYSL